MKLKNQAPFKFKSLFAPCRSILRIFKLKKPLFIKAFRSPENQYVAKTSPTRKLATGLRSFFKLPKNSRKMDRLTALKSFSDSGYQKAPFPSPLTPVYLRMSAAYNPREELFMKEEMDEACRSFEKYLMEMIVAEGKVESLVDVEEFLYNWNNLKCPVFVDLVSRFYKELCKDLFRDENEGIPLMRST